MGYFCADFIYGIPLITLTGPGPTLLPLGEGLALPLLLFMLSEASTAVNSGGEIVEEGLEGATSYFWPLPPSSPPPLPPSPPSAERLMATAGEEALGDGLYSGRESEAPGGDGSFVLAVPS